MCAIVSAFLFIGVKMLVLSRKTEESVIVDGFREQIRIMVLEIKAGSVVLGFEANENIPVHREEVWKQIIGQKIK